jgi:hypothetical protein
MGLFLAMITGNEATRLATPVHGKTMTNGALHL